MHQDLYARYAALEAINAAGEGDSAKAKAAIRDIADLNAKMLAENSAFRARMPAPLSLFDEVRPILVTCPKALPPFLAAEMAALGLPGREMAAGVLTKGDMHFQ